MKLMVILSVESFVYEQNFSLRMVSNDLKTVTVLTGEQDDVPLSAQYYDDFARNDVSGECRGDIFLKFDSCKSGVYPNDSLVDNVSYIKLLKAINK